MTGGWQCEGPRSTTDLVFRNERPKIVRQFGAKPLSEPSPFVWLQNSQERRAFEFYIRRAGPLLSGALDWGVWGSLVPCLAESDVTVRYIMLAISHFCEHPIRSSENGRIQVLPLDNRHVIALQWQARAISLDRQQNPRSEDSGIVLKYVLLSCHEFQQNNYRNGWRLLRVAYSLVAPLITSGCDKSSGPSATNDPILRVLIPCMMRNLCLLFNPRIRHLRQEVHLISLEEGEVNIFNLLCAVYASVKTEFFAHQSNAPTRDRLPNGMEALRSVLMKLRAEVFTIPRTGHDQVQSSRRQALHDYCNVGLYWLDVMADLAHSCSDELDFLQVLLESTKKLCVTAPTICPTAASTTFFHSFAIYPIAFFVTIFSRDPRLKSEALAILNERTHHNSMPHLLALVRKTEQHTSNHADDADMSGVFQIHHGSKDQELYVDEVYAGSIQEL